MMCEVQVPARCQPRAGSLTGSSSPFIVYKKFTGKEEVILKVVWPQGLTLNLALFFSLLLPPSPCFLPPSLSLLSFCSPCVQVQRDSVMTLGKP